MTVAELVIVTLKLSIFLLVFALGLLSDIRHFRRLFNRPTQMLRSLLAMNVLMPLFATALAATAPLSLPVKGMLIAVALAPLPPILPRKEMKAGGDETYAVGLLFTAACLSIVTIPLAMKGLGRAFHMSLSMPVADVAQIVIMTTLLPLSLGLAGHMIAPKLAQRISPLISLVATITLVLAALVLLFGFRHAVAAEFNLGALAAITAFVVFGLGAGYLLGGEDRDERAVLALSTAMRHPGMALAIASANFPEKKAFLSALFLYLLVGAILSTAYLALRRAQGRAMTAQRAGG